MSWVLFFDIVHVFVHGSCRQCGKFFLGHLFCRRQVCRTLLGEKQCRNPVVYVISITEMLYFQNPKVREEWDEEQAERGVDEERSGKRSNKTHDYPSTPTSLTYSIFSPPPPSQNISILIAVRCKSEPYHHQILQCSTCLS